LGELNSFLSRGHSLLWIVFDIEHSQIIGAILRQQLPVEKEHYSFAVGLNFSPPLSEDRSGYIKKARSNITQERENKSSQSSLTCCTFVIAG